MPADDEIDPSQVPKVRVEDLDKYGKTEIVSVFKDLKQQNADEFAPECGWLTQEERETLDAYRKLLAKKEGP